MLATLSAAQPPGPPPGPGPPPPPAAALPIPAPAAETEHQYDSLMKAIEDLLWYHKLGDIAEIDKVRFTGPPLRWASWAGATAA